MRQCQQRHRFRNLWISQRHKNLDISITKHWFFFKYKNSLITYRGLLYSKYFHRGGNLNAKFGAPKIDYLSQKQCVTPSVYNSQIGRIFRFRFDSATQFN